MIQEGRDDWVVLTKARGCPSRITAALVAEAAGDGDPDSAAILDRARRAVAFALTQAITLLAPRRIVIGGGVSLIGEKNWFDPIRRLVDRDVFEPFRGRFDIVPAALGEEVVVHGALALARDAILDCPRHACLRHRNHSRRTCCIFETRTELSPALPLTIMIPPTHNWIDGISARSCRIRGDGRCSRDALNSGSEARDAWRDAEIDSSRTGHACQKLVILRASMAR